MSSSSTARAKGTLLIIEDDPDVQFALARQVKAMGFRAVTAGDPEKALQFLDLNMNPHAILCDITMPKMTGLDFLKHLRGQGNDVPFVLMTAYDKREHLLAAIRLGATDFLEKPYDPKVLRQALTRAIEIGLRQHQAHEKAVTLKAKMPAHLSEVDDLERHLKNAVQLRTMKGA